MPRYAILKHETPAGYPRGDHWDLLIEDNNMLLCWAMESAPEFGRTIPAEKLADHRLMYLDYEGPVSNNRGHVTRVDSGEADITVRSETQLVASLRVGLMTGRLSISSSDGCALVQFHRTRDED